ncbi:MAG: hypothetical protein ONB23_06695 [candidate division KSB1 bacterium]|nr:hypothetical protein [candidate division KSB1 bacterium]
MHSVEFTELIITCEACGNVYRYPIHSQEESRAIFEHFRCDNNCGRNLYSFITLGKLRFPSSSSGSEDGKVGHPPEHDSP